MEDGKKNPKPNNPLFSHPGWGGPELIRSPCAVSEPALLSVGPSFPRLAGSFPEDAGCRLHPGRAGDAPLNPHPEPSGTTEPSTAGENRHILGVFKSRSKRRVLEGWDGGRSSWRCQWDGDEEPRGDVEIFHPRGRIAAVPLSPQAVAWKYERFHGLDRV